MLRKILLFPILLLTLVSCQFTETMVLNKDGSGRMAVEMDLSEMMKFAAQMAQDSTMVKTDTVISFKKIFEEKKDSIAKLSKKEQQRLKQMENYNLKLSVNPENNAMLMAVFIDFKNVNEANDLMNGFSQVNDKMPGVKSTDAKEEKKEENDILGVRYFYKNKRFKRDAYIKDETAYKNQLDSLKNVEQIINSMNYVIKYTFPTAIKKASVEDAVYSADKKTITITRSFSDYFKNPDILDIEIELEK